MTSGSASDPSDARRRWSDVGSSRRLERPWGGLHHQLLGDPGAPKLLYVNGSGSTVAEIEPLLGPWIERFRLLVFDHRGMGESDVPDAEYSMADLADDVIDLVDAVGWSTFRVFGISFGGMVAQHVAARVPERVERMVLACTSSGGAGGSSYPLHDLYELPVDEQARRFPLVLDTRFTPEFLKTDEVARLILGARRSPTSGERLRGLRLQMNARRHHDAWDALPSITCPVLVAAGATDGLAPPENSRRLAGRLVNSEYREFVGGHPFVWQDRTAVPSLIDFLADRGSPTTDGDSPVNG